MDNLIDEELVDNVMIMAEEEVIGEGENAKKRMCFKGVFSEADSLNGNKRVYPKEVLRSVFEEAKAKELKTGQPIFGELEHACFTYNTFKVLTKVGYKPFTELNVGEEVLTLNEDNVIEYKPILKIINSPYSGKVYHIKGRNIDTTVTGNHKFFLLDRDGKRQIATAKELFDDRTKYSHSKIINNSSINDKKINENIVIEDIYLDKIEEEDYTGNIYCLEVEDNHNFYIEDKNKFFLTGNSNAHVNLERIAVTFPELTWDEENGKIYGKAVPTLTEAGRVVEGLAKSGFKICFSTRMTGKTKPMTEERKRQFNITEDCSEVMPGAKLISIDIVANPSCANAVTNTVYEEKMEIVEEKHNPKFKTIFDSLL